MLMSCLCRFFFHLSLFFFSSSSFHLSLFFFSSSSFSFLFSSSSFHLLLFIFFFQLSLFIFFSFIFLFSAFIYQSSVFHGVLIDFIYISPPYGVFCLHCSPYPSFLCLIAVIDENLRFRGKKCCCRGMKESVSPLLSICGVLFCHDAKLRIMQRVCNSCRSVVVQALTLVFVSGLLSDRYKFCDFCFLNCDFCARLVETLA